MLMLPDSSYWIFIVNKLFEAARVLWLTNIHIVLYGDRTKIYIKSALMARHVRIKFDCFISVSLIIQHRTGFFFRSSMWILFHNFQYYVNGHFRQLFTHTYTPGVALSTLIKKNLMRPVSECIRFWISFIRTVKMKCDWFTYHTFRQHPWCIGTCAAWSKYIFNQKTIGWNRKWEYSVWGMIDEFLYLTRAHTHTLGSSP